MGGSGHWLFALPAAPWDVLVAGSSAGAGGSFGSVFCTGSAVGGSLLGSVAGGVSGAASDVGVGAGTTAVVGSLPAGLVGTTIALRGVRATISRQSQAHVKNAAGQLTWWVINASDASIAHCPSRIKRPDFQGNHNDRLVRRRARTSSIIRRYWAVTATLCSGFGCCASWLHFVDRVGDWCDVQVREVERVGVLLSVGPAIAP